MICRRKVAGFISLSSLPVSSARISTCIWDPTISLRLDHPVLVLLERCQTRGHFKQIISSMMRTHLVFQTFPLSRLLNFSASSHTENLDLAMTLFENFAHRPNLYMYNMMIRALSFSSSRCYVYYRLMLRSGISPDHHTIMAMIKSMENFSSLKQVHAHAVIMGLCLDSYLQNSLMKMYCENGEMGLAREIFRNMKINDVTSYNIMIMGLAKNGNILEALELTKDLIFSDFGLDEYTAVGLLLCCSKLRCWLMGRSIHAWMIRRTCMDAWGMIFCNSLLDFYTRSGDMKSAMKFFDWIIDKDDVTWNTMIARSAEYGLFDIALTLFDQMPERGLVAWNSLLNGYAHNGYWDSVITLFKEMVLHKIILDRVTIIIMLRASSELCLLHQGRAFHGWVFKNEAHLDPFIVSALVDMYSKCGSLQRAISTFRSIPKRDVAIWTSMISGLAFHGRGPEALHLYKEMHLDGVVPNELTFIAILTACAHAGFVESGCAIFDSMKKIYSIVPTVEHYGCFVDILARAGRLREGKMVIRALPMKPSSAILGALLAASKAHGEIDMARFAYEEMLKVGPEEDGSYVLLSSAYASSERWDSSGGVRELMDRRGVKKMAGWSRVFIENVAHGFVASDLSHPMQEEIYGVLSCLHREMRLNLWLSLLSL